MITNFLSYFVCLSPEKDRDFVDEQLGSGAHFVAVPRVTIECGAEHVDECRSSPVATRPRCKLCDTCLMMHYDIEEHTDWVTLKTLDEASKAYVVERLAQPKHIYCDFIVEEGIPEGKQAKEYAELQAK